MPINSWLHPPDNLNFESHQADVWRVSLDLPINLVKSLESTLSTDESQRAARFHFPEDKNRYIAAHGCLRKVLARYLRCEPSHLKFYTNDYGKPALHSHKLEFNLSHSDSFALIAITKECKVGVDVERIRSDLELESIANRYFSPNEVSELMALPSKQRIAGFFNCWTRKEAYIKAHGMGLSLPLDSFDVSLTPGEPATLRTARLDTNIAARWTLHSLEVDPFYASALAIEGSANLEIRLWDWNIS